MQLPKKFHFLTFGALAGCLAVGYLVTKQSENQAPTESLPSPTVAKKLPKLAEPSAKSTANAASDANRLKNAATKETEPALASAPTTAPAPQPQPEPNLASKIQQLGLQNTHLTTEQLAQRAANVEKEANRELERLVPLLHLTPQQQEKIFDRLAQNSTDWHPSFQLSPAYSNLSGNGSLAASPTPNSATDSKSTHPAPTNQEAQLPPSQSIPDLLTSSPDPILTPDQEEALLTDETERQEWWDEMITRMKSNMENGNNPTVPTTPTTPADDPNYTKEVKGGDVIVD